MAFQTGFGLVPGKLVLSDEPFLPRQGEVAAKLTEGEGTTNAFRVRPLRAARAAHLPLAGKDWRAVDVDTSPGSCDSPSLARTRPLA